MVPPTTPGRIAGLFAALGVALAVAAPQWARADWVAISVAALPRTEVVVPQEEPDEGAVACLRPVDASLLVLWMIIGDVPVAPLSSGNPSGNPSENPPG